MTGNQHSANFRRGEFNTLAQRGTNLTGKPALIIQGNGSDLTDEKAIKNRAKRKLISQAMSLSLVDASSKYGSPELKKSYWNAHYCQSKIHTVDGRIHAKYCKTRCCTVCLANRQGDILNRYMPIVKRWEEPYFLTLTVKSVPFHRLRDHMRCMIKEFQAIIETYRKREQRGTGFSLIGIKSLESNYNPTTKEYNPHFHVIVANKRMAEILFSEWLQRRKRKGRINRKGQMMRKVRDTERDLIEVVKYGSKIFTEQDIYAKGKNRDKKGKSTIYAGALNNIFHAMRGLRIFERFGFNIPDSKPATKQARVVNDYYEWQFHAPSADWLSTDTGNPLSNFIAPFDLTSILENSIDIQRE